MLKKRITTTTITHETIRINSTRAVSVWCSECRSQSRLVTPAEARRIAGVNSRTIYAWVEAGRVHHFETHEGFILICLHSLTA